MSLPRELAAKVRLAKRLRSRADVTQAQAVAAVDDAVRALQAHGLTMREIGAIFDVGHTRIVQIAQRAAASGR